MSTPLDMVQIKGSALHGSPRSFGEYAARTRDYLDQLQKVDDIFQRISVLVGSEYRALPRTLSGLEEAITAACFDSALRGDIINVGETTELTSTSLSRIGFTVWYSSFADASGLPVPIEMGGIKIIVQGVSAGKEPSGGVILSLPTGLVRGIESVHLVKRVMAATIESWDLAVIGMKSPLFEKTIRINGDLYSGQWLLYLPFPDLGACLPDDIHWEPFCKGVLIQTTPHLPDAENPADVAAGKRVREVLDEFGFAWQSTYAIHGWPPDAEEWRYEEFITGAPSNRKYRVRCIDFDGYDSERGVLLYAKLFRRLRRQPKQWGLRGWDGPVINEARRQVRAANGTPIEWHIGLEESADRARTLLAEYTDIAEAHLKIIHTPFPETLAIEPGKEPRS